MVLSLSDFEEYREVRSIVNESLLNHNKQTIETVSETIFPQSLYQVCNYDRECLYNDYLEIFPRIQAIEKKKNGKGTYFQRLIAYESGLNTINQLELIISNLLATKNKRRSKLQASIFDPSKDHTDGPYQGFPCLQHITFYETENGGLVMSSFYAVQYLFERAYGNWLGLINLGKFIANETGLDLVRFNCFIGVEKLDEISKNKAKGILKSIENAIP